MTRTFWPGYVRSIKFNGLIRLWIMAQEIMNRLEIEPKRDGS